VSGLELVLLLLAASVCLRIVAERWRIPYATLLVLGGLALAEIPHLPRITLAPNVLFLVFVPPLLYWGAAAFPLRDLRRSSGPILRLAVLMVLVSAVSVAVVIRAIDPAFTWAAAFALGAIISPPDPVAVLSVMRSVRLPRQIERILEGEGLLNDATALVLYRIAVAAAVTGVFVPATAGLQFLIVGLGGAAIGLVLGVLILRLRRLTQRSEVADTTLSLLTPFAAYLAAESVGCSGVLAVVATGMYIGRNIQQIMSPASRLQTTSMWTVTTYLLESLIFILIGVELPYIVRDLEPARIASLAREAGLIFACIIVVRLVWLFPSAYVGRTIDRWIRHSHEAPPSWRQVLFVGWAGVRGGDSLVIALALPLATATGHPFPARERIIFITFGVICASLVLQAPTLRPLARALGLHADGSVEDEQAHARLVSAEAGLVALDELPRESLEYPEVLRYLRQRHLQRARRWAADEARRFQDRPSEIDHRHFVSSPPSHEAGALDEHRAVEYRRIRSAMIAAERRALFDLRDKAVIGDDVMTIVQHELDLEQMLLDSAQPVVEPPSEVRVSADERVT
jgi:CPA1 family monovalent cation:H+ antiporter